MSIHPQTRIGHVHLKVADLERSIAFYSGVLGFEITQRLGNQAVFLSAGGYHHHLGLNTWESAGASPPRKEQLGSTISPFCTQTDGNWLMPCSVSSELTSSWTGQVITV